MLNVVVLIGRFVRDPELRYTQNNKAVCNFCIAVDRGGRDDGADFIDVVCWDQTANFVKQYGAKGRLVAVKGRLATSTYEDREGHKVHKTEVVADMYGGIRFLNKTQESKQPGDAKGNNADSAKNGGTPF